MALALPFFLYLFFYSLKWVIFSIFYKNLPIFKKMYQKNGSIYKKLAKTSKSSIISDNLRFQRKSTTANDFSGMNF